MGLAPLGTARTPTLGLTSPKLLLKSIWVNKAPNKCARRFFH